MDYERSVLDKASDNARDNHAEISASAVCGCFSCLATFPPAEIERWFNEGAGTAVCPECQIDSVLGSASGLPVDDRDFLKAMQSRWFS